MHEQNPATVPPERALMRLPRRDLVLWTPPSKRRYPYLAYTWREHMDDVARGWHAALHRFVEEVGKPLLATIKRVADFLGWDTLPYAPGDRVLYTPWHGEPHPAQVIASNLERVTIRLDHPLRGVRILRVASDHLESKGSPDAE